MTNGRRVENGRSASLAQKSIDFSLEVNRLYAGSQ